MTSNLMSEQPLVSVIIPAYNAEAFIQETLRSVLAQTYTNLEVLVVDDGSHDRTAEMVKGFVKQDARVTLLQQPNAGVAAARNLAIQQAKGEFIAPIDADDIWFPQNIAKQVQRFVESSADVGLVYSWSLDIDEHDLPIGEIHAARVEGDVYLTLLCHYFLANASASLIRRSCLEKVGTYNCKFRKNHAQGCEDWDLYLRLAEEFEFRFVPEFLVSYRKIQHSMSCNYSSMAKSHTLMLQSVRQNHLNLPEFIYRLSSSSFYIYLARQCHQKSDYRNTLTWLKKALKIDFIMVCLRTELYTLLIKSLLKPNLQSIASIKPNYHLYKWLQERWKPSRYRKPALNFTERELNQSKFTLEVLLHKCLPVLVSTALQLRIKKQEFQRSFNYRRSL